MQLARLRGCIVIRRNNGAVKINNRFVRFGMSGLPDLHGYTPDGTPFEIEVKAEKGRLSPAQIERIEELKQHNVRVAVLRSIDEAVIFFDQVNDFLKNKGAKNEKTITA